MAAGVEGELLCPTAQEFYAAPVSDSDEEVQIQQKRFGAGKDPAAATVRIPELDFVRSPVDHLA
ncbi:MAG TPA: hypothetical protein VIY49_06930 [Bryobacteraceae bacterium]